MTFLLTGVAVLTFGWVEDLAAGRRARLWPAYPAPTATGPATGRIVPDVPRQGRGHAGDTPVTERLLQDMPVAGRPPVRHGAGDGVPWAGNITPQQGRPPLSLRFTGHDEAP